MGSENVFEMFLNGISSFKGVAVDRDQFLYAIIILHKRKENKKYEKTKENDSEPPVNLGVSQWYNTCF